MPVTPKASRLLVAASVRSTKLGPLVIVAPASGMITLAQMDATQATPAILPGADECHSGYHRDLACRLG